MPSLLQWELLARSLIAGQLGTVCVHKLIDVPVILQVLGQIQHVRTHWLLAAECSFSTNLLRQVLF
jgi:hypothetical protein